MCVKSAGHSVNENDYIIIVLFLQRRATSRLNSQYVIKDISDQMISSGYDCFKSQVFVSDIIIIIIIKWTFVQRTITKQNP